MDQMDVAVFNAAVADYTPVEPHEKKVKRGAGAWSIELKPTKDIAGEMGKRKKPGQLLVGFALETDNEVEHARSKLKKKNSWSLLKKTSGNQLKVKNAKFPSISKSQSLPLKKTAE